MKLSTTILSATLLAGALALAGCGGSSDSGGSGGMDDMSTPEEQCKADGGALDDGECKSADDLIAEREAKEKMEADEQAAADRKQANENAMKLFDTLSAAHDHVAVSETLGDSLPTETQGYDPKKAVKKAMAGFNYTEFATVKSGKTVHVLRYNTMGDGKSTAFDVALPGGANVSMSKYIAGSQFATSGNPKDHKVTATAATPVRVSGTYQGASGTYTCTGAQVAGACISQMTNDGIKLGGTSTWSFTPNEGAMVQVADTEYVEFGWWLNENATNEDTDHARIESFAQTHGGSAPVAVGATVGTASYNGLAAGKAVVYSPVGGNNVSGAFTADVTLSADFDKKMISGQVGGFMVGDEQPNWSVTLEETDLGDGGTWAKSDKGTVWSINDVAADAGGMWQGSLHSQKGPVGGAAFIPTEAVGGFSSNYGSVGHMVGAFGAEQ